MDLKQRTYFEKKANYKPQVNKITYSENLQDINYISSKIRSTAKDALSELISPKIAKKEISDLFDDIKKLKKQGKK